MFHSYKMWSVNKTTIKRFKGGWVILSCGFVLDWISWTEEILRLLYKSCKIFQFCKSSLHPLIEIVQHVGLKLTGSRPLSRVNWWKQECNALITVWYQAKIFSIFNICLPSITPVELPQTKHTPWNVLCWKVYLKVCISKILKYNKKVLRKNYYPLCQCYTGLLD